MVLTRSEREGPAEVGGSNLKRASQGLSDTSLNGPTPIERSLVESEARKQAMFEAALDCIIFVDMNDRVVEFNRAAEKTFGCARGDAIGSDFAELFIPPASRQRYRDNLARYSSAGEVGSLMIGRLELQAMRKDGKSFIAEMALQPIPLKGAPGFAIFLRDITATRMAKKELERFAEELQRSNQELEEFAYMASHDLQAPVRRVRAFCKLLRDRLDGRLQDDDREFMQHIIDSSVRMQRLIEDLLAFSRIDAKGKEFKAVDMDAVVAEALSNLEIAIQESNSKIKHDPLPTLHGDHVQLVALLQNLIGNAVKYRGEKRPRIHIGAQQRGDSWLIGVSDNGIGIDPKEADKIFAIFRRLHGDSRYSGTGIGLAICKKVVERHQGRIWVKSEPGAGSIFYFKLPAKPRPQ